MLGRLVRGPRVGTMYSPLGNRILCLHILFLDSVRPLELPRAAAGHSDPAQFGSDTKIYLRSVLCYWGELRGPFFWAQWCLRRRFLVFKRHCAGEMRSVDSLEPFRTQLPPPPKRNSSRFPFSVTPPKEKIKFRFPPHINRRATRRTPPIHEKESILLSPLGWRNAVHERSDQKNMFFNATPSIRKGG